MSDARFLLFSVVKIQGHLKFFNFFSGGGGGGLARVTDVNKFSSLVDGYVKDVKRGVKKNLFKLTTHI